MAIETLTIKTKDGLNLDLARYPGGGARLPAFCIPGLTRNRRDFDDFAKWLSARGRDVYAISLRGRGRSDYDPKYLNYFPTIYREDVLGALDTLGIQRAVFVGTSLGGIVTMLTNESAPERVAAAIINDVGPELATEGIVRIASYVGASDGAAPNLDQAAAQIRAVNEVAFPGKDDAFWRDFARNTYRELGDGTWKLDYDPAIAAALKEAGPAPDLWSAFTSLKNKPTLILRGAISDLLTPEIIGKMRAVNPAMLVSDVASVGHAPTLTEPDAVAAMGAFLDEID